MTGWLTHVRLGRHVATWIVTYNGIPGAGRRLCRSEGDVREFCRRAGWEMVSAEPGHALPGTEDSYTPARMPGMASSAANLAL